MDLDGATCLVTGANRGIGLSIARELTRRRVRLLAGMRRPEAFMPLPPERALEVRPVLMDLSSRASVDASLATLGDDAGGVDILVNNAGVLTGGLLEDQSEDDLYGVVQVNLLAAMHLTRRLLPAMVARGRGKIVNNASISGYAFFPGASTYAASKAGIVAFTESLHRELRGTGVTTLQLVTPAIATDMLGELDRIYGSRVDTSRWNRIPPGVWAARAVRAIEDDRRVLDPGGGVRLAKLASRGPAFILDRVSQRIFTRARRDPVERGRGGDPPAA